MTPNNIKFIFFKISFIWGNININGFSFYFLKVQCLNIILNDSLKLEFNININSQFNSNIYLNYIVILFIENINYLCTLLKVLITFHFNDILPNWNILIYCYSFLIRLLLIKTDFEILFHFSLGIEFFNLISIISKVAKSSPFFSNW